MQLIGNAAPDVLGDTCRTTREMRAVRHVEIRFIKGKGFDDVGVIAKDRMNFLRGFPIGLHAWLDDGQVRAQFKGMP
ncbi:hypothetical protein D3C72_1821580 [compost metagenome]